MPYTIKTFADITYDSLYLSLPALSASVNIWFKYVGWLKIE